MHIKDGKNLLVSQLNSGINALRRVSVNASFKFRSMLANGMVISKLIYLINVWVVAPKYILKTSWG